MAGCQVVCVVEHHLRGRALTQAAKRMDKAGWTTSAVAAVANPEVLQHEGPGHGGVAVMTRKNFHHRRLTPSMKSAIQSEEHHNFPTQWTATTLRLAQTDVIILSA